MYQHQEPSQAQIESEYHKQAVNKSWSARDQYPELPQKPWAGWQEPAKPRNRINLVEIKYPNGGDQITYGFWRTDGILSAYTVRKWKHTKVVEICLEADLEYSFEIDDEKTVTLSFWRA